MRQVPVLDYRQITHDRRAFVAALGESLETFGFVSIVGHGIDPALIARAYALAAEVFALPDEVKRRYETPKNGRQRGYTGHGVEHAKDSALPDLKEFWHVGRDLPPDHPLHRGGDVPANLFPAEVPDFAPVFRGLFAELERLANDILACIGEHLGYPEGAFREMVRDGNSVQRIIHYPDDALGRIPGAVRAAAHEDINLLTVLPASTRPGLELLTREGAWLPITPPEGAMVVDTGDMMQLLTGGRLPAVTHRVVNPPEADGGRLSMPFFCHPHPDYLLAPNPPREDYTPLTARDYLAARLRETGVM